MQKLAYGALDLLDVAPHSFFSGSVAFLLHDDFTSFGRASIARYLSLVSLLTPLKWRSPASKEIVSRMR